MEKVTEHINNLRDLQCPDRNTEDREDRKDHRKKNNSHGKLHIDSAPFLPYLHN